MFLTLLTLIAIFLIDGTLGKAFDSQRNNKDIFQNDSRGKQCAKELLWNNHATFCTIPLKSETNDGPASTIEQLSVPDNCPAITTSSFLQLPNDSPANQPSDPHNNPASFMSIFLSQLTIVPTSSFLHIHVPTNATNAATGFRIHYDSHQTSLNDVTIAYVSATTARTTVTMTNVFATRNATTKALRYQLTRA
jgi:hypothetical protein